MTRDGPAPRLTCGARNAPVAVALPVEDARRRSMLAGATCHRRTRPRPRPRSACPTALTALLPRALLSPRAVLCWFSCISSRCRRARRRRRPPPPRCCRLCRHRRHRRRGQRSMRREQRSLRTDAWTTSTCTGAAQRSAAQRTAFEVSEHGIDTTAAQACSTQAHRTSVDGFQLKERRCDVLPA